VMAFCGLSGSRLPSGPKPSSSRVHPCLTCTS
jgi:hypothetical protein